MTRHFISFPSFEVTLQGSLHCTQPRGANCANDTEPVIAIWNRFLFPVYKVLLTFFSRYKIQWKICLILNHIQHQISTDKVICGSTKSNSTFRWNSVLVWWTSVYCVFTCRAVICFPTSFHQCSLQELVLLVLMRAPQLVMESPLVC